MKSEISKLDDVQIFEKEILGQGYISVVKRARHKQTGKEYACKIVLLLDRSLERKTCRTSNTQTRNSDT